MGHFTSHLLFSLVLLLYSTAQYLSIANSYSRVLFQGVHTHIHTHMSIPGGSERWTLHCQRAFIVTLNSWLVLYFKISWLSRINLTIKLKMVPSIRYDLIRYDTTRKSRSTVIITLVIWRWIPPYGSPPNCTSYVRATEQWPPVEIIRNSLQLFVLSSL